MILKVFILTLFLSGIYHPSIANATGCTYCYQIASVEITFRNKKVQHGYISWSPNHEADLDEKAFLEEAKKTQRIRFYKEISKQSSGAEENEVNVYYALARNVILLRRYDIKRLRIIDSNYGSARRDIRIVRR